MARTKPKPRPIRRGFGRLRQFRSGRWKASYTGPDGKLYEAPHTFGAQIDAEAWLVDRRREIDRELWSPPATAEQKKHASQRKAGAETFKSYSKRWLNNRTVRGRPLKPRTVAHYQQMLDDHILPTFGSRPVRDITRKQVATWHAKLLPDAPTMRAHAYSLLRTILETARTDDPPLIDANPCAIRGAGTARRASKTRPATLEQLAVLEAAMPEQYRLMVTLAAWCALRFGELVELRRDDIDTENALVMVQRAAVRLKGGWKADTPKSYAGIRDVAVPPHIWPAVAAHLAAHVGAAGNALLFPARTGRRLQPSTFQRWYYKARAAAKRPDLRFHDLRHTGATMAAQAGATTAELMARIGHSTPGAAMRYQHAAQGRDKQIAAALSKLAGPKP